MTIKDIEDLLPEWQKILRLQDWDVKVVFKRYWDMENGDLVGQCQHNVNQKHATIKLLDPQDLTDNDSDQEYILVHELLHLHTSSFHNPETGKLADGRLVGMEAMVDQLSIALVKLKRQGELRYLEGQRDQIDRTTKLLR